MPGTSGFVHEAAFYGSEDELASIVVPFVEDGRAAGEPALLALRGPGAEALRRELPESDGVAFLPAYGSPAATIRTLLERFRAHVESTPGRLRVVGEPLDSRNPEPWEPWARYEAAINAIFAEFPVWGLCPYDTRATPDEVLGDVERTHPRIAMTDGRHVRNDRFEDPRTFLARLPQPAPDPLERTPAAVELRDPTPAAGRAAVTRAARRSQVHRDDVDGLVSAVSEAVANAHLHGRPPVRVRAWAAPDRIVVTVTDRGTGPRDPFAGLVPAHRHEGGLGLWMSHQLCGHVAHVRDADGFTIRLTAGDPPPP